MKTKHLKRKAATVFSDNDPRLAESQAGDTCTILRRAADGTLYLDHLKLTMTMNGKTVKSEYRRIMGPPGNGSAKWTVKHERKAWREPVTLGEAVNFYVDQLRATVPGFWADKIEIRAVPTGERKVAA